MKQLVLISAIAMILFSCQNRGGADQTSGNDQNDEKVPAVKAYLHDVDKRGVTHVETLIDHYLHVQTALANDDSTEAKAGAAMILNEIKKFDTMILTGNHRTEYNKYSEKIRQSAEDIGKISDIATERSNFKVLSDNMYGLAKAFGYKKTLYKVHCPMAFNHQGADWLTDVKEVKNPYYGKNMLECGTVEEAIENR